MVSPSDGADAEEAEAGRGEEAPILEEGAEGVRLMTAHRAKGLEFKVVFLFGISEKSFPVPRQPTETDAEYDERRALEISQLFVAMTRARDELFLLSDDNPSEVLYEALDYFDEEEA